MNHSEQYAGRPRRSEIPSMSRGNGIGVGFFRCAFARRNCAHPQLFRREYQRTNRTKENKILRCFPHCCPQHVVRSYCGASLHVQVDFIDSDNVNAPETVAKPTRGDDLMVFGRFRPDETPPFELGVEITGASILSSLQSEDNPAGEWIEARLIASVDQSAWLFEVNPSARWCYNWGSSAAKDKRQQKHVFDVYVLYQPGSGSSSTLQVVAGVSSSSFNIVSFRRAPSNGGRSTADTDVNADSPPTSTFSTPITHAASFSSATEVTWEEKARSESSVRSNRPPIARREYPMHYSASDSDLDPGNRRLPVARPPRENANDSSELARWQSELQVICGFFAAVPVASCLEEITTAQERYRRALLTMWPRLQSRSTVDYSSVDPILPRLLTQLGARTQTMTRGGPQLRPDLMQEVVALAFWLHFHAPFLHEVETQFQQAASVLLARPALLHAHARWVRWLYQRIDGHLQQESRLTLSELVRQLRAFPHIHPDEFARSSSGLQLSLSEFIAQASEVYIAMRPLERRRYQRMSEARGPAHCVNGTWLCNLENCHFSCPGQLPAEAEFTPRLELLLEFWRQLSCVTLQVLIEGDIPILEVASVFHPDARCGRVARLELDNDVHWFRAFPCGESTAAHVCSGQTFGDYRGYVAENGDILLTIFSWPSPHAEMSIPTAYCWHWRLRCSQASFLEASVRLQRGVMTHMDASLAMESLHSRLARIQQWDDYLEAEFTYEKAERNAEDTLPSTSLKPETETELEPEVRV